LKFESRRAGERGTLRGHEEVELQMLKAQISAVPGIEQARLK
jgi:hypothetical protein